MKLLILSFILFTASAAVFPSTDYNLNCRNAYHDIICLDFGTARSKIESEKSGNPSNSIPYLLENYIDFLTVMISEKQDDLLELNHQREFRLQKLAKGDRNSPWYLYSQAELYLQSGFTRIKFAEYVSAGLDVNRSFRLLEENNRKFPEFTPNKILLGFLHTLVGTVPDKYQWAVKALDFSGTVSQGIDELRKAYASCLTSKQYEFLLPESAFLLSFVSLNLSGDKSQIGYLSAEFGKPAFLKLIDQSPLARYAMVNLRTREGKNDEAISLLSSYRQHPGSFPFYYLDYLLGVAKLNRLDQDAYLPLMRYVGNFRGMNYIRSAYEHLAWYYLLNGNMDKYCLYMQRISLRGMNAVDNDRQALADAGRNLVPDTCLLKARLFFDGGYYEKSLAELSRFAAGPGMKQPKLKLEYTYRTGRVFDETGNIVKAIHWYEETIKSGEKESSYFAPNAALHLGLIYESQREYQKAALYYQKCLDMDFEEYNFSITQKAKSGLNRVRNR